MHFEPEPAFNYVELKENALMPFGGALFETSILANNFLMSYWPLSSDFIGVDWSNSGKHLSLATLGINDLRLENENLMKNIQSMTCSIIPSNVANRI